MAVSMRDLSDRQPAADYVRECDIKDDLDDVVRGCYIRPKGTVTEIHCCGVSVRVRSGDSKDTLVAKRAKLKAAQEQARLKDGRRKAKANPPSWHDLHGYVSRY